jgi:hypothetical protein
LKPNLEVVDVDDADGVADLDLMNHGQISINQISAKGTKKIAQVQNVLTESAMTRKVRVLVQTKQQYVHIQPGTFSESANSII